MITFLYHPEFQLNITNSSAAPVTLLSSMLQGPPVPSCLLSFALHMADSATEYCPPFLFAFNVTHQNKPSPLGINPVNFSWVVLHELTCRF